MIDDGLERSLQRRQEAFEERRARRAQRVWLALALLIAVLCVWYAAGGSAWCA